MTWKIYRQPGQSAVSAPRRVAVVEANSKGNALRTFGFGRLQTPRTMAVDAALVNVERGSARMELEVELRGRGATRYVAVRNSKRVRVNA